MGKLDADLVVAARSEVDLHQGSVLLCPYHFIFQHRFFRSGGCNGNLKGICQLVTGMKAEDVIARLGGTLCGFRNTSCPDQIAQNLKKALEEMN